jgi:hypothetical protein
MKTQTSIQSDSIYRLLFMVPLICSMGFAACPADAGTARTHLTVNLRSALAGKPRTGHNVTIGPKTYYSKEHSFERPWPFGPEFNPQ